MSTADARVEAQDVSPGVRLLTLHNPSKKNALNPQLLEALAHELSAERTHGVRALVLRGAGGTFCSGYDVGRLPEAGGERLPDEHLGEVLSLLEEHPAPSVALIEGHAHGAGVELLCACDLRVASEDAVFRLPPARLGIMYAERGLWRVTRLVGPGEAKRLFFAAERWDAAKAKSAGLVEEVRPAAEVEQAALNLAAEIAHGAPLAVQGMKRAFRALLEPRWTEEETQALRRLRAEAYASEDAREGKAAFIEKRPPRFQGR
jgi:enoyl-CoA hydratase/carnithine racemase